MRVLENFLFCAVNGKARYFSEPPPPLVTSTQHCDKAGMSSESAVLWHRLRSGMQGPTTLDTFREKTLSSYCQPCSKGYCVGLPREVPSWSEV